MVRWMAALSAMAMLAGSAFARGGGGGYYITFTPAAQPGNACIADGVGSGQETKLADGSSVLVQGVHGADTRRCPDPAFPNLATTQKILPDEVRNVASTQCVPPGAHVGDEVNLRFFGRATVLQVHSLNTQCGGAGSAGMREATVISSAAYRALQAARSAQPAAPQPPLPPTALPGEAAPPPIEVAPHELKLASTGTGFFVSQEGHVLSNAHVVEGCARIAGKRAVGPAFPLAVLILDKANDLAVLQGGQTTSVASFRIGGAPLGESITIFGFPLTGALARSGNLTTGSISGLAGLRNDPSRYQISAPVQPGNSGGAVLDESGAVVGVVVSKLDVVRAHVFLVTCPKTSISP